MTSIILPQTCRIIITDYPGVGKQTISCHCGAEMCPKRGDTAGMFNAFCHFQLEWTENEVNILKSGEII